jgi:thioredoxin-dependent peroxiredoxin
MTTLKVGDPAPDFHGINQTGIQVCLTDYRGKKLALYFYPKDNTPGCTTEACNLRDNFQDLKDKGVEILGVSPDNESSHLNFIKKNVLPFDLIPDIEKKIIRDYGAWGPKKLYGREYEGLIRTTFLIDEKGLIEHIFTKVDTRNHAQQILAVLT